MPTPALDVILFGGAPNPILSLDFVGGVYRLSNSCFSSPSDIPGWSFARASIGTAVNSAGTIITFASGQPRITDLGLLIEESRTNLFLRSQDFTTTWSPSAANITGNAAVAPDGTMTASLVVPQVSATDHYVSQAITTTAAGYAISWYAKPNGYSKVGWREASVSGAYATFNLTGAGSVISTSGATGAINSVGGGWYRVSIVFTGAASSQLQTLYVLPTAYTSGDPHLITPAGDGVSGAYFWAAQGELGGFPTSYIPTTSAAATRAADVATMALSGGVQGTLFVQANAQVNDSVFRRVVGFNDGTVQNETVIELQTATARGFVSAANVGQATFTLGAWSGVAKAALAYATNDFAMSFAGSAASTVVSGSVPTTTTLGIGNVAGIAQFNGYIQRVVIYPTRLSNAQIQALTQ